MSTFLYNLALRSAGVPAAPVHPPRQPTFLPSPGGVAWPDPVSAPESAQEPQAVTVSPLPAFSPFEAPGTSAPAAETHATAKTGGAVPQPPFVEISPAPVPRPQPDAGTPEKPGEAGLSEEARTTAEPAGAVPSRIEQPTSPERPAIPKVLPPAPLEPPSPPRVSPSAAPKTAEPPVPVAPRLTLETPVPTPVFQPPISMPPRLERPYVQVRIGTIEVRAAAPESSRVTRSESTPIPVPRPRGFDAYVAARNYINWR